MHALCTVAFYYSFPRQKTTCPEHDDDDDDDEVWCVLIKVRTIQCNNKGFTAYLQQTVDY